MRVHIQWFLPEHRFEKFEVRHVMASAEEEVDDAASLAFYLREQGDTELMCQS